MLYNLNCLLPSKSGRVIQYSATITATLGFLMMGTGMSWTSPMLLDLEMKGIPFQVSRDMGSWIVSAMGFGGILGPLPSGFLADRLGRKPTIILATAPSILAWLIIAFTRSASFLVAARFLIGISVGAILCVCPMYIGEIAEEEIRGVLGTLMQFMMTLGSMFEYVASGFLTYQELALSSLVFPAVLAVLMLIMPETPTFFAMRGRAKEAEKSLQLLLRGSTKDIRNELEHVTTLVEQKMGHLRDLVATRGCRRALLLMLCLLTVQQFCGITAFLSYTEQIFSFAPGTALSSRQSAMIFGVIQVLATLGSTALVDRLGRRPLLLISAGGCALSEVSVATLMYLHAANIVDTTSFSWLPLALLVMFLISFCLGLGPLPLTIVAEIFPPNVKGMASAIGGICLNICFLLVTKLYQIIADNLGSYSPFWFFGTVSTFGTLFVYFMVPETKGKKLDVIVAEFNDETIRTVEI